MQAFRELLDEPGIVAAPGTYNPLSAMMAERAGSPAVYVSGYSIALARYGLPDLELVTRDEMVKTGRYIAEAVDVPVVIDGDTGYGGVHHIRRTTKEYIDAGVDAIHFENQVPGRKRCGHIAGKQTISTDRMVGKLRAALDARGDSDVVIIQRLDNYGSAGGTWDDHVEAGKAAAAAGADLIWPEMPTPDADEAIAFVEEVREEHPDARFALNYSSSFDWYDLESPPTFEDLEDHYDFVFVTLYGLHSAALALYDDMEAFNQLGAEAQWDLNERYADHPTESHHEMAGVGEYQDIERRFDPTGSDRIDSSEGFNETRHETS